MFVYLLLVVLAIAVTTEVGRRALAGHHFEHDLRLGFDPAVETTD